MISSTAVTSLQNPGFRIRFENFTGSLVTANWTDSDDYCLESYVLNVTRDGGPPMSYSTQDSSVVLTNISSTIDYGFIVIPVGMYLPRNDLASDPRTIRFDSKCIADVKHIVIFFLQSLLLLLILEQCIWTLLLTHLMEPLLMSP